jgi:hypothetical protein
MNFSICRPQKTGMRLDIKIPQDEEIDQLMADSDIDVLEYEKRWGAYRLKLTDIDFKSKGDVLIRLLKQAYDRRS